MEDFEVKVRFLSSLGVKKEQYPTGFFDTIQNVNEVLTNTEIGYCALSESCGGKPEMFCIKDVIGTDHDRYANRTWIDAFMDLDRGAQIISMNEENPAYWEEMKQKENADIGLIKSGDKYYIFSRAGGGNNRIITMKIKYLALIEKANGDPEEIDRINKEFTFYANIRELPKDNEIPFIVFSMCEDLPEMSVKKEEDIYTVYKKFTNIELFKGDSDGLKQYFKDLFDVTKCGEDIVRERLEGIERGCNFSPKKHREVLEGIIPQLRPKDVLDEEVKIPNY